jgi:hypothetical protein
MSSGDARSFPGGIVVDQHQLSEELYAASRAKWPAASQEEKKGVELQR